MGRAAAAQEDELPRQAAGPLSVACLVVVPSASAAAPPADALAAADVELGTLTSDAGALRCRFCFGCAELQLRVRALRAGSVYPPDTRPALSGTATRKLTRRCRAVPWFTQ